MNTTFFQSIKKKILKISDILETLIALFLILIAFALTFKFIYAVLMEGPGSWTEDTIHHILIAGFNLVIAVEFVRMLLKHSAGSVLEIVLFSVARGMVVEHSTELQTLFIVVSLGLVFFIRKYLLLPHDLAESMEAVEQYQCQQEQPHIHEQPPRQTSED